MDMNLNPHCPLPSPCLGWNILKMSLVYFPCLFYRINIILLWFLLIGQLRKWYVVSFQDPFLVGLWNATNLGPFAKFLYFENQIATLVLIWEKLLLFETQITIFVGIFLKVTFFYWKCCISSEIYKFATFSISYVKLKLFNQLLQSQFNKLVSLDCLNLSIILNFLDIFFVTLICAYSFVKICDLMTFVYKFIKTIFELKPIFFFTVTKKKVIQFTFLSKMILY